MTSTSAPPRPDRFHIDVPHHWARFDLSDADLARARRQVLKQASTPVERMEIEDLFKQARALNRSARKRGALWGAGTATFYDDALFMGHVMVFAIRPPEGQDFDPSSLVRAGDGTGEVHPRFVAPVELPHVGAAVRVIGTENVEVTRQHRAQMLSHHTLVPVPGSARDVFMITCCSPNLALADAVHELFDAIAESFRFITT